MAEAPAELIGNPADTVSAGSDTLSDMLRAIRLSGSLQFCFMPAGDWQTDDRPSLANMAAGPSSTIPFHIVAEGECWLKINGEKILLEAGDVVAFPFGTGHQLGAGAGGRLITPVADLPPKPWRRLPVLSYGDGVRTRLLCGYLQCDAMNFRPLRHALPVLLHVRPRKMANASWLQAIITQIVSEVDQPRTGGLSTLERLTEITFIELLRHQILGAKPGAAGWLAALADASLGRCLSLIHDDPHHDWSVPELARAAGLSRSALSERFSAVLDTSPMRYVRDWRLYLASVALATTDKAIATIAYDAGYGTEAAFSRAFAKLYAEPPAAWRHSARQRHV